MPKRNTHLRPDLCKPFKRARTFDLYNHKNVERVVSGAFHELKQEQISEQIRRHLASSPSIPRNILPFNTSFTKYDLFLDEKDKCRAISTAKKVLAGPLPPPPPPPRKRMLKDRTKARGRLKSLRKICTQVAATHIKLQSSEMIAKLPVHLKQRLLQSTAKRHHLTDQLLVQFKDSDYERVYLKCGTFTNQGLAEFFDHSKVYACHSDLPLQSSTGTSLENPSRSSSLKSIDISFCKNLKGRQTSTTIVDSTPALTHLNIAGCFDLSEGPAALGTIARGLSKLVQLDISSVSWLIDSMLLLFIDWETQLKDLKVLIIDNCTRVDGLYIQEKLHEIRADLTVKI
ncbi:hypothetical protein K493DRAFT_69246 [Basidiobolus meristosporus CBS 931.73]|uniref:RNI-like protein n=1 Tax=Basidiobolus meristosporus CBS 931.73 TaxID=1314790 RepID=A0A1Y1XUE5_9FUNG|nr:hypothetical protein K493DRAFT_69246 [Basidiobolus meristosporus CBS 931.73]|eukprot:ORX89343.1 hypothetical protein K493DRAFT_69246 [Basidiobolus meristosporus CBS 931.73]